MHRFALFAAALATMLSAPAWACGPSGDEAFVILGLFGGTILFATVGQWAAVRLLGYAAASPVHLAWKILGALPAASIVGAGLAIGFTALAKGATGFGITLVCIELLVLISALRAAFWNHRLSRAPIDV